MSESGDLREFIQRESSDLREFIQRESTDLREFMREQSADLREFMREQTLLSQQRLDRLHKAIMADIREFGDAMRQHHEREDRKLDDVLAENRAQREALFRMLDRLDGGGATPPA